MSKVVLGIDPGKNGALVWLGDGVFIPMLMPFDGDDLNFIFLQNFLLNQKTDHVFLERAVSFGMGVKGAFNYGRAFAAVEIAVKLSGTPVTYVEPGKWAKEMHAGIDADLKPKAKSAIAVKRLYPHLIEKIPCKKTKLHDGIVDAILISGYGRRVLNL